jgi:hypothetical protein
MVYWLMVYWLMAHGPIERDATAFEAREPERDLAVPDKPINH